MTMGSTSRSNWGLKHFLLNCLAGWDDNGTATRVPLLVAMFLPVMYEYRSYLGELTPAMESLVTNIVGYSMIIVVMGAEFLLNMAACHLHRRSISPDMSGSMNRIRLSRLFGVFIFIGVFAGFMSLLYMFLSIGMVHWHGMEFGQAMYWSYGIVLAGTFTVSWLVSAFAPMLMMGPVYRRLAE